MSPPFLRPEDQPDYYLGMCGSCRWSDPAPVGEARTVEDLVCWEAPPDAVGRPSRVWKSRRACAGYELELPPPDPEGG